ncbi:flagellar basal-body MS-ring/collar protein FliF [Aquabacterium sp. A08]|uniref:flagellar basal-body MS-ring/collar protein FliF n=1 Tax=Aquabacterium sp. A08 TaxID=2718532 RepID=UPI00141FAE04|nr:flagellar basal-body MS-ring/collar protein FliF [Aquabacterium sp. A08]NIC41927.1 flagellar basal body M-ring protein FliF [Aquabacterium sp. A08]NIC41970.1 flagellar basal body M-ring protein FliF [Aquabacterium sp. A08]
MNTAVAELDVTTLPDKRPNPLVEGFARLDNTRKGLLGLGVLALVGVLAAAFFMANRPDYRVLYANLSDKDGGAVLAQLSQMNVPYKHAEGGSAILVPADRVHDTRLKLASQGLPKGAINGFELMDANRLGMTQFQERLTFQRGLEGELTRSITALSSVAEARVHLALPNQNGFFREQQKPSASVLLTLYPGRTLDRTQVAGIVHLVASSVPEMNPKAVSVVDQHGALLSQTADAPAGSVDSQQLEYVRTLEQMYTQRIMDLLEPVLGRENVRAQVTADVDFSQTEQTSEQHRPNQGTEPAAVRSQQLVESGSNLDQTTPGAPGAVSNVAPGATEAPINGAAAPAGVVPGGNAGGASEANRRREQVINYEVDKTVSVTRNATGTVRRLSAAVVLNHVASTDRKGQASSGPLPPEQMEQINALVREAIGFNTQRGDSVNVMNAAFNKPATDTTDIAWWKQADTFDLARSLAWPVGMLVLGLILFLGMVRPALKLMKAPPAAAPDAEGTRTAGGQLDTLVDDEPQRPGLPMPVQNEVTVEMLRLEDAKRLARENPVAVANIVKGWVNGESAAAAT